MDLNDKIKKIISDAAESDYDEAGLEKYVSKVAQSGDWEEIRKAILSILYDKDKSLWNETVLLIYYLVNRDYKFDETETIALLYDCLSLSDDIDSNIVWSIARIIKSEPYLSDYDPYNDEIIFNEMEKIRKNRI